MTYRERRLAKAARLRDWADKREAKATAASQASHAIATGIPFGQPILVGHHSERRMRRDLDKIDRGFRSSHEHQEKAESMRSRADNIEAAAARAIYSDDSDAFVRLTEKLDKLEADRAAIKAYNRSCRTGKPDESLLTDDLRAALQSARMYTPYFLGKHGEMPAYKLSNLGGEIARLRKRLTRLGGAR